MVPSMPLFLQSSHFGDDIFRRGGGKSRIERIIAGAEEWSMNKCVLQPKSLPDTLGRAHGRPPNQNSPMFALPI